MLPRLDNHFELKTGLSSVCSNDETSEWDHYWVRRVALVKFTQTTTLEFPSATELH